MDEITNREDFYNRVIVLLEQARNRVKSAIDTTMVYSYYEIGRMIIEEEQNGSSRAECVWRFGVKGWIRRKMKSCRFLGKMLFYASCGKH